MIKIAIMDDDRQAAEDCMAVLQTYADRTGREIMMKTYSSPTELLSVEDSMRPDMAFLDILLKEEEEDGIQAGCLLNQKWPDCCIIYLTDYITYASDVYRTKHTYFVLKNELEQRVDELFDFWYNTFHIFGC